MRFKVTSLAAMISFYAGKVDYAFYAALIATLTR
jgi:hypothetical protein